MKLRQYLTEAKWIIGQWLKQERRSATEYGVVVEIMKNGAAKVISISDDRQVATINSTKGWFPVPTAIKVMEVPEGLFKKIEKKAKKTKYSGMKLR